MTQPTDSDAGCFHQSFCSPHHELDQGGIDLIEGYGAVRAGNSQVYQEMREFIGARNLRSAINYQTVSENYLDIPNFIDYHLAVIYFQNFDIGNIKSWRPRIHRGKFRWMVYDQDYGFNLWPPEVYLPAMARDFADYRKLELKNQLCILNRMTGTA